MYNVHENKVLFYFCSCLYSLRWKLQKKIWAIIAENLKWWRIFMSPCFPQSTSQYAIFWVIKKIWCLMGYLLKFKRGKFLERKIEGRLLEIFKNTIFKATVHQEKSGKIGSKKSFRTCDSFYMRNKTSFIPSCRLQYSTVYTISLVPKQCT